MSRPHVRIETVAGTELGAPHVVKSDRVFAVGEDGTEVDISRCVVGWRVVSEVGDARKLSLDLLTFHLTESEVEEQ